MDEAAKYPNGKHASNRCENLGLLADGLKKCKGKLCRVHEGGCRVKSIDEFDPGSVSKDLLQRECRECRDYREEQKAAGVKHLHIDKRCRVCGENRLLKHFSLGNGHWGYLDACKDCLTHDRRARQWNSTLGLSRNVEWKPGDNVNDGNISSFFSIKENVEDFFGKYAIDTDEGIIVGRKHRRANGRYFKPGDEASIITAAWTPKVRINKVPVRSNLIINYLCLLTAPNGTIAFKNGDPADCRIGNLAQYHIQCTKNPGASPQEGGERRPRLPSSAPTGGEALNENMPSRRRKAISTSGTAPTGTSATSRPALSHWLGVARTRPTTTHAGMRTVSTERPSRSWSVTLLRPTVG
jgi:hypothetical protein